MPLKISNTVAISIPHTHGKGTVLGMLFNPQNPEEDCVCDEDESKGIFGWLEGIPFDLAP